MYLRTLDCLLTAIYGSYFGYMRQIHEFQQQNPDVPSFNMAFEDVKKVETTSLYQSFCRPPVHIQPSSKFRLVGRVVKASASRAEDPGFEFRLQRDFFGVESYQ